MTAPDGRTSCEKSPLPGVRGGRRGRKLPTINCPTEAQTVDRHCCDPKEWEPGAAQKRGDGDGCSQNWGVESKAKGGHERPGSIGKVPAGKSRETLGRERKEGGFMPLALEGWLARGGEWGLLSRLGGGQPLTLSGKSFGFLRCKLTNVH